MPRLWDHSIDTHRDAVRRAIMDAAWTLAVEHGLTGVTMAGVAREAGIGRATLYRYFADPEAILFAWHERAVTAHLGQLAEFAQRPGPPLDRLDAVLAAWAGILQRSGAHGPDLGHVLHKEAGMAEARAALGALVTGLISEAVAEGSARTDASPEELAVFCLHAMSAVASASTEALAKRLAAVAVDGVRPPRDRGALSAS